MANDAIAAIATPPGKGGIGVVRVSGPGLARFLEAFVGRAVTPRIATRVKFRAGDGTAIDDGLVLYFVAPNSYTGEDVVEAHGHGGPVVLQLLLGRCLELGARLAEPGEFTRRAFLNDKLDLAQAEAVADVIGAATEQAARCAVRSLEGEFSRRIRALARELLELRIMAEAAIDFADEEIEVPQHQELARRLAVARQRLHEVIVASRQGSLLREGVVVVLAGAPNVGKSSLLNRLAGIERAIVSDIPGTTRDVVRDTIAIEGVPVQVVDTAGLRSPQDAVEAIGVQKTREAIAAADLMLWMSDATRPDTRAVDLSLASITQGLPRLDVINKIDLSPAAGDGGGVQVSAKTGEGLEQIRREILRAVGYHGGEGQFTARTRHLVAMGKASENLKAAGAAAINFEILAEELRLAHNALTGITGEFTTEDLLGEIFARFCIGK